MPMLTLSMGQGVRIGDYTVTLVRHRRGQVVVRAECPRDVEVCQVKQDGDIKPLRRISIAPLTDASGPL